MKEQLLTETQRRLYEKLHRDFGDNIIQCLGNKEINEIMLNPDGKIWIDSAKKGLALQSEISKDKAFSIINGIAGIHNFIVNQYNPRLEAELPYFKEMCGERFTAQVPPIVSFPCFNIRKKSELVFTLEDYLNTQRITETQREVLRTFIRQRKNILICGGPGSGKTTVTNALIVEAVKCDENQRFLILEDLPELQCTAQNKVSMLTTNEISMTGLLKAAMRMRPDRILIGEVRGAEALDMLKAWNTGCPGGICTVHANGCLEAIQRILDLSLEAGLVHPPVSLVEHTVHAIVFVERKNNQQGFISEIQSIKGHENGKWKLEKVG
jgi:P-type conjugative transfer ATPase TrbB